MNIPVEALDAIAAAKYATLDLPESWSDDYENAPAMVKHGMREAALETIAPGLPIIFAAWEKERQAAEGKIDIPDDLSGLLGGGADNA